MDAALSSAKLQKLEAVSNERGVIAATAMDQRGSLRSAIAQAGGFDKGSVALEMMSEFKEAVVMILTPHASAVLLDPEYGLGAAKLLAKHCGLVVACERSGYEEARPGRLPRVLDHWTVRRLVAEGADCIKALFYYDPFEAAEINDIKHCWVERVGAECLAADVPFFLELVGYGDSLDVHGIEYARRKPEVVRQSVAEFSKPEYRVDVLKVEIPVNLAFVKGARACHGEAAYTP
jgi:tagatose 1,6-diphosphate aldolase